MLNKDSSKLERGPRSTRQWPLEDAGHECRPPREVANVEDGEDDATTYQTLKENLIAKCCSSLKEILQRDRDGNKPPVRVELLEKLIKVWHWSPPRLQSLLALFAREVGPE